MVVSIQSLVLIAVDRFGAVVFPLHSPLIRSKRCPFFILGTWTVAMAVFSPYFLALRLVEYQAGTLAVPFAMKWSLWRFFVTDKLTYFNVCCVCLYSHCWLYFIPSSLSSSSHRRFLASRRSVLTNNVREDQKRNKDGHCYRCSVCTVLGTLHFYQDAKVFFMEQIIPTLWTCTSSEYHIIYVSLKLCHQPMYLFYFQLELSSGLKRL